MRIYISGPITGHTDKNSKAFEEASTFLTSLGFIPINPVTLDYIEQLPTWEANLKRDIKYLLDCEAVFLLPNWETSKGAKLELTIALGLNLKVFRKQGDGLVREHIAIDSELTPLIPSCLWNEK